MIVIATDEPLRHLLESGALITSTWPRAHEDVFLLLKVLHFAFPSLSEAIGTGLVALLAANLQTSEVTLSTGAATVLAVAQDQSGERVADPKGNAHMVTQLDIFNVAAEGRAVSKVAR
ncbi:hypothetical protein GCM10009554_50650 [Kribbella koreensis]|uniref:Uncharacterized protein n=1 Tax=Kribbella koreensis TaxID=57909 RepID=A0ABN1R2D5_9ACTN